MENVAIDLGRPNSVMCELGADSRKVLRRFRLDRPNLTKLFASRPRCRVLIESCTDSEWVARHLEGLGHEVVVTDPNYAAMYGERNRRVKTDGRDADALFEANRLGVFRRAHRRSDPQRRVIAQQGVRGALVRTRTRWINVVRALLRREGCSVPSGAAETFQDQVHELELPGELGALVAPLLSLMDSVNERVRQLDRETASLGREDPRVRLLQTAPMVGAQTATAFVALIDDVARFAKAHKVESYLGLVPSEWSSSERKIKEGITKRGDSRVRWLLVETSWSILNRPRPDTLELRNWALAIAARRGKKIAVVALARRLGGILYAMLRDNKPYDPTRLHAAQSRYSQSVAA
jgi:transposase